MNAYHDNAQVELLREAGMTEADITHSRLVAGIAVGLGSLARVAVDLSLVALGALFHDLGKVRTDGILHGVEGARLGRHLGLPGAVLWALMNKVLFGHYIATGYGDVSRLFGWHNVLPALRNYGETCARILPLGVLAALATTRGGRVADPRATAAAATWVVLVGGFYCFYQHTQEVWWYLRFVLPAFPALIVLAVGGLRQVHGWLAGPGHVWRLGLAGAVVVTLLGWQLARQVRACEEWWVLWWGEGELRYVELCRRLETHAPANAVVFAMQTSGALFSLQPWVVVRRDCMTPELSAIDRDNYIIPIWMI